jgi:choline kinase
MRLIILAAGQGKRLRPYTNSQPKCLVNIRGRSLLQWQIDAARAVGIKDIVVVGGYLIEQIRSYDVTLIENPHFAKTNMVQSLRCATDFFGNEFVMSYGDIIYSPNILDSLLSDSEPISVSVDLDWRNYWEQRLDDPLSDAETLKINSEDFITEIGQKPRSYKDIEAQYIGLVSFRKSGVSRLNNILNEISTNAQTEINPFGGSRSLDQLYMTDLMQGMIDQGDRLHACKINGRWLELDTVADLLLAEKMIAEGRLN